MHPVQLAAERLLLIHISGDHREELIGHLERLAYDFCEVGSIERALPLMSAKTVARLTISRAISFR